jgi:roadblock/LC7 domain-containing protein
LRAAITASTEFNNIRLKLEGTMGQVKNIDELVKIDGVALAFEFTRDGKLVKHRANGNVSPEVAGMTAQFCSSITQLFDTLGGAYTKLSGSEWSPQHGWAYSGGKYTVCVGGTRGVFVETSKADYNKLFEGLVGGRPA